MKAVVIEKSEYIYLKDVEEISLKNNEVKVKVKYTGICGSDIPRALNNGAHNYPIILGHEFSGKVVDVGTSVKGIKVGDHVVGIPLIPCMECEDCKTGNYSLCKKYSFVGSRRQGSMAEYIVLDESNVLVIDKNIPLLDAAFFEPSSVAIHAIKLINFTDKSNACIVGNGTIGALTLQWLKIIGINKVTVIGRNTKKLNQFYEYGADNILNVNDEDFMDQVNKVTNGKGFANVFECAGTADTTKLCFKLASNRGNICYIGTPKNDVTFTVKEWENINRKELKIAASWMSYSSPFPGDEWTRTNEEFKKGNLKIYDNMIHGIYKMEDAATAFNLFKSNVNGKIIIENEFYDKVKVE